MNQTTSVKLDLAPKHIDVMMSACAEMPWKMVQETISLVMQQANEPGLQNPPPPPVSFVENEIRTAFNSIATMGPMDIDELIHALRVGRGWEGTSEDPVAHVPV